MDEGKDLPNLPGVREAFELVRIRAEEIAFERLWKRAPTRAEMFAAGCLSKKWRDWCLSELAETFAEVLEDVGEAATPKICELLGLPDGAEYALARSFMLDSSDELRNPGREVFFYVRAQDKVLARVHDKLMSSSRPGWVFSLLVKPFRDRVYLDVTHLSCEDPHRVYKAVTACREALGISQGKGRPKSKDLTKAMRAAFMVDEMGMSHVQVGEKLGFPVYRDAIRSASPLVTRYLRLGRELRPKLAELEQYLQSLPTE